MNHLLLTTNYELRITNYAREATAKPPYEPILDSWLLVFIRGACNNFKDSSGAKLAAVIYFSNSFANYFSLLNFAKLGKN